MHLKNWALLYPDGRTAALAPAYDLVPTSRYTKNDVVALPISGERRLQHMTRERLIDAAFRSGVSRHLAGKTVDATVERVRSAWPEAKERFTDRAAIERIEGLMRSVPVLR